MYSCTTYHTIVVLPVPPTPTPCSQPEEMLGHLGLDDAVRLSNLGELVPLPLRLVGHLDAPVAHRLVLDAAARLGRGQRQGAAAGHGPERVVRSVRV